MGMKIDKLATTKTIVGALALHAICLLPAYAQEGGFFTGKTISLLCITRCAIGAGQYM